MVVFIVIGGATWKWHSVTVPFWHPNWKVQVYMIVITSNGGGDDDDD